MEQDVLIAFINDTIIEAKRNGDCFITDEKPDFPDDLSVVTVSDPLNEYELHDVEIIECASVDGLYWFTFRELSAEELKQREYDNTIQMLTDCLLEMSEAVYA